uniref:Rx N-terminal domain-containing protein n=1 Tax=Leersia perrieri TaxID=77586 RepID=A0A0D9Y0B9_9ORYZ
MEATVVSVGRSVLNGALGFAKSTLVEEVSLQLGVQRDHAFIRDELEMMNSFLMAAHDEKDNNKVVMTWVKQVRDVAYDAEDCLQGFAIRLGRKKTISWWLSPHTLWERRLIAKQMKELRGKVEDVSQRNMRYQLIKGSKPNAATDVASNNTARETMSDTHEARRQNKKAIYNLVQLVNKKVDERRVIAVWGTSGDHLGDTSIVGKAYDDMKRTNTFECCAWIDLVHPFKPAEILQAIVRQFYTRSLQEAGEATSGCQLLRSMLMKKDHLDDEFYIYLSDKRYLIVLNDLSTTENWKQIKMCFPYNKKGSRIIVSTCQVEVATLCAGTEEVAPKRMQLFTDQTLLYAFYYQTLPTDIMGADDGITESTSILDAASINNSIEGMNLTRTKTMIAAFKESDLIGRICEKEEIIELILKDTQQNKIISV